MGFMDHRMRVVIVYMLQLGDPKIQNLSVCLISCISTRSPGVSVPEL